ncbi:unnamed protein product [Staurois parvus]|uniref:Uncharacterized protein n=1 Tax=Staurois parvus TaxID=386267 RepID=A0ABN9FQC6_9NEOB|nr:unnamed protein product [Staurois parvus]
MQSTSATCRLHLRNMQTPPPQHADSTSATCRLHLRNIAKIRTFLTPDTTKQLIHSLIISRLDCNSLLTGLPRRWLSPLQSILNTAARLIHLSNRSVSATPLCQSLHWPPLSVLHPPLPIPLLAPTQCPPPLSANPSLASIQCPPPLSANPSTGPHSVSSTPLCQSLHWPPLSVLHPSLPIPMASTQCPPPLSANPSTGF